jgi:ankyrin repeat protein
MLSREIIDQICLYLPLEKVWHFSPYATKKIYNPEIHDARYWLKVTNIENIENIKDISIIKYFLEKNKIQQVDKEALCCRACCYGRTDILQLLLDNGMDPKNDNFSLRAAGCNNQLDTVKFLINLGYKIKDQDTFSYIAQRANHTTVKWLLENNHYSMKNDDLSLASTHCQKHMDVVKLLLEYGGNLHLGSNRYIIIFACEELDFKMIKLLLEYGADITFNDNSAIKTAKKNNRLHIVKLLSDYAMRNTLFKYIT